MLNFVRTSDFDFELPPELIAQQPAEPRDSARLMVLRRATQTIEHHHVRDLPDLLAPGSLMVVNDTRVMAARLFGRRPDTGGSVEVLLLRPFTDRLWEVMFRPGRQAQTGRTFQFDAHDGPLRATVTARSEDAVTLEFERAFDPSTVGQVPLPPYIRDYHGDPERYQTVYSREPRSAAAPTAGLHFTPELLLELALRGIERAAVTLEVGPGTFKPVTVDDPREHHLHSERVIIPESAATAIHRAKSEGRPVVAIGTTVVRTLEHVARERGQIESYAGETEFRILPGDPFLVVDQLMTNFHLPRSTLLMLVCALAGTDFILNAYRQAVAERYRFYSFGDAMLVL